MPRFWLRTLFALAALISVSLFVQATVAPKLLGRNTQRFILQTETRNPRELAALSQTLVKQGFDVAGLNAQAGQIEVLTTQLGSMALRIRGYQGAMQAREENATVDPRYLNPERVEAKLKSLNAAYPDLTRLEKVGTSLQGRPIYAMLISNTPKADDSRAMTKPSIIFDGVHHAREVMTAEVVMDVAEYLLANSKTGQARDIVESWQVWVLPMLNVDGSNIVFTQDNWWRKNAHGNGSEIYGVDINRNYSYNWNVCNGSSGTNSAQDYRGDSAGSEPETKALMNLAAMVRPTASLSYHSYSELVLYSYGCNGKHAQEQKMVEGIGKELANILPSDSGRGYYEPGTPWELLYDVDGDSMDHIYGMFGSLSYTFEINQSFQPNYSVREPTLAKHRKAWGYFFERMNKNLLTVVTTDASRKAMPAELVVDESAESKGTRFFQSNAAGYYFKVLDAGRYTLHVKNAKGTVQNIDVVMNGSPQTVEVKIQ